MMGEKPKEQPDKDVYLRVVEKRKDGIVVSGVKMSITQVAYADEMFVLPTRALMEDDSAFAVAFAVPADWEGVHLITRPVWHREKDDPGASPFCKYGVSDSVVVFDNVFVPNERVFMCGEWEFGRRIALLFADSHRHSYSGCKPGVSDILCGTTALAAEANNIQKVGHVREKLSEFAGAADPVLQAVAHAEPAVLALTARRGGRRLAISVTPAYTVLISRPQYRQTIASLLMSSAQYGHFFMP